jgi:hypothetical protein
MKNHKTIKKVTLLLLFSFIIATSALAQTTWYQYYFVFPENSYFRTNYTPGGAIPNAEVKVASPVANPYGLGITYFALRLGGNNFPAPSDGITTYQLNPTQMWASYCQLARNGLPNTIGEVTYSGTSRNGVMVALANNPVSGYAMTQANMTTDASSILEERELGTDYWQIGYKSYAHYVEAGAEYDPKSGYIIVATQSGTDISVNGTLVKEGLGLGDVYCRYMFAGDLTGEHITTTKPVAFFSMTTFAQIPISSNFNDVLFEQIPPTNQWGRYFIIPMASHVPGDTTTLLLKKQHVRVLATQNETSLTVSGMSEIVYNVGSQTSYNNLSAGEFVEFELTNPNGAFISSNNPVGVCAYLTGAANNRGMGDPAQVWIPPIAQRDPARLVSAFIPHAATYLTYHYVVIVTPTATKSQTSIDGGNIGSADWIDVNNSGYSFCLYPVSDAAYNIANPEGVIVYGLGLGPEESYYYIAGSGHKNISDLFTISGKVSGLPNNVGIPVYYTVNSGPQKAVTTVAGGAYTIPDIPYGANVVITASSQPGYTASVASTPATSNVTENIIDKNIVYATGTYTISGTVSGLPNNTGVHIYYTVNGGTQKTVTTTSGGAYIISNVPFGANVVITPEEKSGYTAILSPTPSTSNVTENLTEKDIIYEAHLTISGTVNGLPDNSNVPVYYTINGGTQQYVTTNTDGTYIINDVPYGVTVIIVPSAQTNYGVCPANRTINSITSSLTDQDFVYIQHTINGTGEVCVGNSMIMSATIAGGEWSSENTSIATIHPITGEVTGVSQGNTTIKYTLTQSGCTFTVPEMQVTVTPKLPHAVTISSDNNVCFGTSVTFTANSNAAAPNYQWKKNGVNINGATAQTYTYIPVNDDEITCEVTSNDTCVTPLTATSNLIKMIVTPTVIPAINIILTND